MALDHEADLASIILHALVLLDDLGEGGVVLGHAGCVYGEKTLAMSTSSCRVFKELCNTRL